MAQTIKWGRTAAWMAPAFLVATFLMGGGARSDILSLVFLRPLAAVVLCLGLTNLSRGDIERQKMLFGCLVSIAFLAVAQLIPLPPGLWQLLPGRDVVVEVDEALGMEGLWRPISLAPNGTLNALLSLLVPAAFLVHVAKLDSAELRRVLMAAIVLGLLSAVIGIAQSAGPRGGGLYFYRVTNPEFAVGLFSNRNHQAVALACLFPMLAAYVSFPVKQIGKAKLRLILVLLVGAALVPLLLITGSRLGAALGLLGILSARWVYRAPNVPAVVRRESKRRNYTPVIIGIVVFALGSITALLAEVSVFGRFASSSDAVEDIRFQVWQPIAEIAWKFFPFGSGLGSFAEVYEVFEPAELLERRYLNHAHNDLLEVWLTAGLAGLVILGIAAVVLGRAVVRAALAKKVNHQVPINRMGAVVVVMLGLASLVDYPLRTPSIACIFILATVCLLQERATDQ